jgi:hypothetical protein
MSEREEEGIAGMSVARSRFGAPIWHSGDGKKGRKGGFPGKGNPAVKPDLVLHVSRVSALAEIIARVQDLFVCRGARAERDREHTFDPQARFDRILSVEMFEHKCVAEAAEILAEAGRALLHAHLHPPLERLWFRTERSPDWTALHFIPGGGVPSHHLIRQYADLFTVEKSVTSPRCRGTRLTIR